MLRRPPTSTRPATLVPDATRVRSRRAAGRAADGAPVLPRVVGDAVDLGDAHVEAAELAGRRLADRHHAAPFEEPLRLVRREGGDSVLENQRRLGPRPAGHRIELLDGGWHAPEGQRYARLRG